MLTYSILSPGLVRNNGQRLAGSYCLLRDIRRLSTAPSVEIRLVSSELQRLFNSVKMRSAPLKLTDDVQPMSPRLKPFTVAPKKLPRQKELTITKMPRNAISVLGKCRRPQSSTSSVGTSRKPPNYITVLDTMMKSCACLSVTTGRYSPTMMVSCSLSVSSTIAIRT